MASGVPVVPNNLAPSAVPPPPSNVPLVPNNLAPGLLPPLPSADRSTLEIPQVAPPSPFAVADAAGAGPGAAAGITPPYAIRPELINAMRTRESGGKVSAVGAKGEIGRMQVLPSTAAMYGVSADDLRNNPELSDYVGHRYYGDLLKRYNGNEFLALVAYNSGPGRVDRGTLLPQSVKYATAILNRAPHPGFGGGTAAAPSLPGTGTEMASASEMPPASGTPSAGVAADSGDLPVPQMVAQLSGQPSAQPPGTPGATAQQPWYRRAGQALGGALEGTAEAAELDLSTLPNAPAAPAAGTPGVGVTSLNPMTGNVTLGRPATQAGVAPSQGGVDFSQIPSTDPTQRSTSASITPSGGVSFRATTRTVPPPMQERVAGDAAVGALVQTMDAINYYDKNIGPDLLTKYKGPIYSEPGWHGAKQSLAYRYPLAMSFGDWYADPQIDKFFEKLGPLSAAQLKGLAGGRLGEGIAKYLAPHVPDPKVQPLLVVRRRLEGLRENLQIVIKTYTRLHHQGMSDDQIGDIVGNMPYKDPLEAAANVPAGSPPGTEPAGTTAPLPPLPGSAAAPAPAAPRYMMTRPPRDYEGANDWRQMPSGKWWSNLHRGYATY